MSVRLKLVLDLIRLLAFTGLLREVLVEVELLVQLIVGVLVAISSYRV